MNEFAINWLKGGEYAEITAPASTALKNKLLRLKAERRSYGVNGLPEKDDPRSCGK